MGYHIQLTPKVKSWQEFIKQVHSLRCLKNIESQKRIIGKSLCISSVNNQNRVKL